jgi:hypothetical protein
MRLGRKKSDLQPGFASDLIARANIGIGRGWGIGIHVRACYRHPTIIVI